LFVFATEEVGIYFRGSKIFWGVIGAMVAIGAIVPIVTIETIAPIKTI
jgi:hypothetical protein